MIQYEFGTWGVRFIFRLSGSVFPVALIFALPCSALAVLLWYYFDQMEVKPDIEGAKFLFSNYCFVLGFLLVFRTQIAYSRFWEGGSILQDMRSSWLNVTSSLVAFSTGKEDMRVQVEHFHHLLIRLMSIMHCGALQEVADMADENFDIINCDGIDDESMKYLISLDSAQRVEVVLQWLQRLIVNSQSSGVLPVPPPILSRVFQELANGRLSFNAAKKIAAFPFPFPYAQMLMVMLMIHWIVAPIMAALALPDVYMCALATFVTSLSFWCINYIAAELEMPYGDNPNDLPVAELQLNFNGSLRRLMNPVVQSQPSFTYHRERHLKMEYTKMAEVENFFRYTRTDVSKATGVINKLPAKPGQPLPALKGAPGQLLNAEEQCERVPASLEPDIFGSPNGEDVGKLPHCSATAGAHGSMSSSYGSEQSSIKTGGGSAASSDASRANDTKTLQPKALEDPFEWPLGQKHDRQTLPCTSSAVRLGTEFIDGGTQEWSMQETKLGALPATGTSTAIRQPGHFPQELQPAPLSPEEWHAFDQQLVSLATQVEERLAKIVSELVHLLVPAAGSRLAEANCLAQGHCHPERPWTAASDVIRFSSPMQSSSPEPELFQGQRYSEHSQGPRAI